MTSIMHFKPPSEKSLADQFPELEEVKFLLQGGFKAVYAATIKGKKQAFKLAFIPPVINPKRDEEVAVQKEVIGRAAREIGLLGKCKRPEIVKLGLLAPRAAKVEGQDFIAYSEEFLAGSNLWDLLFADGNKPSEAELKSLFASLVFAIEEMWSHRSIHRDIKPTNVMKTGNADRPFVLLDLGIAYVIGETALTNAGFPRTNRYMAPEMINPDFRDTLDYRSDLYTTALTVYEYGAQKHPIAGNREDAMLTISRAIREIPAPLKDHRPDLPEEFCLMIDQLLKKNPALRPSNLKVLLAKAGIKP